MKRFINLLTKLDKGKMTKLKDGDKAPDFKLKDMNNKDYSLASFKGKKLILYFYPKDDTSGCTVEACEFREAYDIFRDKGAEIIGVSLDDAKSHKKFSDKHSLPFTILCDTDAKVSTAYGVYSDKKFMGKSYKGINRTTFLIDEKGKILKVFNNVKPAGHAKEILDLL